MTATALQRLLRYPHAAVFDKAPSQVLVLRVSNAAGNARWRIADGVMHVRAGDGPEQAFRLGEHTIDGLAAALRTAGYGVLIVEPEYGYRSALALVEGEGDERLSNGDHVHVFTSILWALLSAYAGEIRDAEAAMREALRQMIITQAEGEWLDLWGVLYGVGRLQGEADAAYAPRIPREAFRIRVNAYAIELAIRDATGFDVRIEEPWTSVFTLSQSELSGPDAFADGELVGYHLIQPTARQAIDWPAVRAVIERNRAAGVVTLGPRLLFGSWVDAHRPVAIHSAVTLQHKSATVYEDCALLDWMDIEDVSVPNHAALMRSVRRYVSGSRVGAQRWGAFNWRTGYSWGTTVYIVGSKYSSGFDTRYLGLQYSSQQWDQTNRATWEGRKGTWQDPAAVIGMRYSESS